MKKPVTQSIALLASVLLLGTATAFSQPATHLAITSVNGGVSPQAGVGFSISVMSQDAGNLPSPVGQLTSISITLKTGTGTLAGTLTGTLIAGQDSVVISGATYTKAETGVALTATVTSGDVLNPGDSSPFAVLAGPAAKIAFTTQPGNGTGGSAFATQPVVTLQDANGNTVTGTAQTVTLAIQNNAGPGGVLSGTNVLAVNTTTGQAAFSGLAIDKIGTGYTLTATGNTVSTTPGTVVSNAFNVTMGPAAKIAFTTQPGNGTGGSPLTTQPVVTLEDAGGNTVIGTAQNITLAIQNNPGGGNLGGTTTVAVNAGTGVATFTNISIDKIGTGYTLTATGSTVSTSPGVVVSGAFNVTLGAAAKLEFGQQPSNTAGGATITPAVTVRIEDAGGNLVSDTRNVTLAIGTNPSGGTLTGTLTQAAAAGIATFNNLVIDKVGNGYTLNATATLAGATSNPFNIFTGSPSKLAFTTQPGGGTGGSAFATQPVVTLEDAGGNPVTGFAQNVTLAIQTNPGGGTLGGTTMVAVNIGTGQAAFAGLSIDKIGNGYTLTATGSTVNTSPGVVVSTAFNVVTGPAAKLAFTTQPGNGTGGSALATQPVLTLQDAGGNTVTGTAQNVTLAIQNNVGGGVLSGTNPVAVNTTTGLATFTNIAIDKIGTGYTLTATGNTVSTTPGTVVSSAFNVTVGTATKLGFGQQPSNTSAGAAITPAVTVLVQDAGGNTVTTDSRNITVAIGTNPAGGVLGGTLTQAAAAGIATFNNLTIDKAGTGYTLTASSLPVLTGATSGAFNITVGGAAKLAFTTQPGNGTGGSPFATQPVVTLEDAGGNPVIGTAQNVTLAIQTNAGPGGVLSGTTTVAVNTTTGQATFAGLSIDKIGTGYTLTATGSTVSTSPGVVVSTAFNITIGAAAKLAFGQQPTNTAGGATIAPPVTVLVEDAGGNTVTTDTRTISLAIGSNPPGNGVLTGGGGIAAVAGIATFSGLSIDKAGNLYTLVATSVPALTTTPSAAFNITTGGLTHFTVENSGAGGPIGPQTAGAAFSIRVVARDAGNNVVTSYTGAGNTVNITSNLTLSAGGGTTSTFVNGVLDPWSVTISATGSDSLTATRTSGGTEKGTSNVFTVNSGPLNNFLVENVGGGAIPQQVAGAPFNIRITARDALNNTVTSFNTSATLTSNAGLTSPVGGVTAAFTSGVLASQSVTLTVAGAANRTITATSGSQSGTSAAFTIVASTPATIAVSAGDNQSAGVGTVYGTALAALVSDAYANPVSGASVTFSSPAAGASGTWPGAVHSTPVITAATGIATAPAFTANAIAGSFVDTAKVTGAAIPALFHLTNSPAAASKLVIVTPPSTPDTAGTIFTTQPVIWVEDANNNLVNFNGTVLATRTMGTGALQGQDTVRAVNGVATFLNLSYNLAETITITFSSPSNPSLTTALSGSILVRPGQASTVAFLQQPTNATAGVAIAPAVTAQIRDAYGNTITTAGTSITMALGNGSTGTLSGTLTQTTVAGGTATFGNLSINLSGAKTLVASSGTYSSATSNGFTISPASAARLQIAQEPTNANAGALIAPPVTVQLKDQFGNNATTSNVSVAIALLTGAGPLTGTLSQLTNASGIASFGDLRISAAGNKTLRVSSGALIPDTSQTFTISALAPKQLVFVQQPAGAAAGATIGTVTVQVQDSLGNNLNSSGVSIGLALNGTGVLSGTIPQTTNPSGLATFGDLSVSLVGSKTLTASSGALIPATSNAFTITAGPAAALAFTTQPGGAIAGSPLSPQPVLTLQDAFGNVVTGVAQSVTVALQANPGSDTLHGTATVAVNTSNGQAVFSGLNLRHSRAGYTLTATGNTVSTSPGLIVSNPFTIVPGTATEVRVETAADGSGQVLPTQNVSSGTSIPAYAIARDQYDNFISDTVGIWSLTNITDKVKAGDLVASGDGRSATFTGAQIGTCVISTTVTGIAKSVTSGTITVVNAGTPTKIFVETAANGTGLILPDTSLRSGRSITVYAIARDNANNFVRNVTANWSLQAVTGGVVAGDLAPASGKSSVFTAHVVGSAQVRADSGGLAATPSDTISVTPGNPATIVAAAGTPQSALIGTAFATNLRATVHDSSNNLVTAGYNVTFAAPVTGAGGTFAGGGGRTVTVQTDASGAATATLFTANRTAGTYQDSAHVAGVTAPALFTLTNTPGTAVAIAPAAGTPQHTQVATTFPVSLAVIVTDSSGNRVPGISVLFSPPSTASSGSFVSNPSVSSDASGVATAPAYVANLVAGPDTVTATAAGVATPAKFILTNDPGGAQGISVYRTLADTALVKTQFKDSCYAIVKDQANNPVNGLWVKFTAPASGASVTFARTGKSVDSALTANGGIAISSAITSDSVAGDFYILATTPAVTGAATFLRTNKPLTATKFAVEAAPSGGPIGTQQATVPFEVLITSRDVYNNQATFALPLVTINISSNAPLLSGGGTLSFAGGGITQTMVMANAGTPDTIKVVRSGGAEKGSSNAFAVVNPVPTVTSITPPNGRKGDTLPLDIIGTGFINGTTILTIGGGGPVAVQGGSNVISPTEMKPTVAISTNAADSTYPVLVTNPPPGGGSILVPGGFSVGKTPPPHIASVAPDSVARLTSRTIVVRGSNFFGGNVTSLNFGPGTVVNALNVDSLTQITANVSVLLGAATGLRDVIVTNTAPAGTGGGSDTLKMGIMVTNPVPTLYSLSQTTGFRTHTSTIQFTGSNFIANVSSLVFDDTANLIVTNLRVDSATSITANVTLQAASALGAHALTVRNAGPGGGSATLAGGYNVINPQPNVTIASPNAGNRGDTLNVSIRGADFVAGASKVVINPSADIAILSTSVDSTTQITVRIAIGSTASLGDRFIRIWNQPNIADTSGTLRFTINLSAPPIPVHVSPPNGTKYASSTPRLIWLRSKGATGYRVQLSTLQTFGRFVLDTALTDTAVAVGALKPDSVYYWHVNASNGGNTSSYSVPWSFMATYPGMIRIADTVAFPSKGKASDYVASDYRMISLPGDGPIPVANYMTGTAGTDWSMVYDNGAVSDYWTGYTPGSTFTFGGGRGFWLVKKGAWIVRDSIASASLDTGGRATVALPHAGWNIIGNPFVKQVRWADIIAANPPMNADYPLFAYNGSSFDNINALTGRSGTMLPYAGYYLGDTVGLAALKVPFTAGAGKAAPLADGAWQIGIDLGVGGHFDRAVSVGALPGVGSGYNSHDYHRPRAMQGMPAVALSRPGWDNANSDFATDIRPAVETVEAWKFDVRTTLRTPAQLTFQNVAAVPKGLDVVLIDDARARTADLRANTVYTFTPATDVSQFRLVVGTPEGVRSQVDGLLPKEFALGNNYPNPFNPSTTIPVDVPVASDIHLTVYNILGAEVRTLYRGHIEAGRYWISWDGRGAGGSPVATGVYFVRLTTANGKAFVKKLMMLK